MEIEIRLEAAGDAPVDRQVVDRRLREWYAEGAEIRYDKLCFGRLTEQEPGHSYRIDLGEVEPMGAIRDLHARLYRFGVKAYIHFIP